MSECKKCGAEEIDVCPECGLPVETYSRVCGYLRPTSTWNIGKQTEFEDRVNYTNWANKQIDESKPTDK